MKETTATRGSSTSGCPASGPSPWTTLRTPSGSPASRASRAKTSAVSGVSSDALSTQALPQTSAGKTFQATFAIGVFAAMIRPATPSGCRISIACRFGVALGSVLP